MQPFINKNFLRKSQMKTLFEQARFNDICEPGTHSHFFLGRVVKNPEADFAASPLVAEHIGRDQAGQDLVEPFFESGGHR